MSNSGEFTFLQELLKRKIFKILLKKTLKDEFGVWLHWSCKTRPSFLNGFGITWYIYWIFSSEWFWIPFAIFMGYKFTWLYLLLILVSPLITRLLRPVGHGFLIYDAQVNEELFDDLWNNNLVGIASTEMYTSPGSGKATPKIIIMPPQAWKDEMHVLGRKHE